MGSKNYLIDTNAVIDYLAGRLPANGVQFMDGVVDELPIISVITRIEVLGFNATDPEGILEQFIRETSVIGLTEEIVQQTITIRKQHKIKLPDAIIAATALVYGFGLITRNVRDFVSIKGFSVIDPHSL